MKSYLLMLIAFGVLLFQGCSQTEKNTAQNSNGDFRVGIIHGMEIPDSNHPEAVKITAGTAFCTGVFIESNPPTVLTASHCLNSLPTATSNDGGVKYGEAKSRHACVPKGAIGHVNAFDIAVVVFEQGAFVVPGTAPLADVDPKAGMGVTLVGFGRNTGDDGALFTGAGIKRLGINAIKSIVTTDPAEFTDMIELVGATEGDIPQNQIQKDHDSSPNHGDSGGPLYLNLRTGQAVVGLVSGGHVKDGASTAYYTNLRSEKSKAFLSRALSQRFLHSMSEVETASDYSDVCATAPKTP